MSKRLRFSNRNRVFFYGKTLQNRIALYQHSNICCIWHTHSEDMFYLWLLTYFVELWTVLFFLSLQIFLIRVALYPKRDLFHPSCGSCFVLLLSPSLQRLAVRRYLFSPPEPFCAWPRHQSNMKNRNSDSRATLTGSRRIHTEKIIRSRRAAPWGTAAIKPKGTVVSSRTKQIPLGLMLRESRTRDRVFVTWPSLADGTCVREGADASFWPCLYSLLRPHRDMVGYCRAGRCIGFRQSATSSRCLPLTDAIACRLDHSRLILQGEGIGHKLRECSLILQTSCILTL